MELQWPLILFTTLVAWSAGTFGAQGALALAGRARSAQLPCLAASAVLLVLSGIAVFFHLQHWERIFNGFGHITSGITQELIAIVLFAVVLVAYLACLRKSGDGTVPKWCAVLAVAVSLVLAAVCAHSYMMPARPAWDSVLEALSLVGLACALGPLTAASVLAFREGGASEAAVPSVAGAAVGAVCTAAYAAFLQASAGSFVDVGFYIDPTHPTAGMADAAAAVSAQAPLLWGGAVVLGALVPLALAAVAWKRGGASWKALGPAAVALFLVGAVCLRCAFYGLGLSVFMFY